MQYPALSSSLQLSVNKFISYCSPSLLKKAPAVLLSSLLVVTGCSSDGNDDADGFVIEAAELNGAAVDGPIINADVAVYILDSSAADLKGRQIATGTTDDQARITGISISDDDLLQTPFLVEISGGEDITTQTTAIIPVLRTLVTARQLVLTPEAVYATPLSTLALEIARLKMAANPELIWPTAIKNAQAEVRNVFGMGLLGNSDLLRDDESAVSLLSTAPFISESTDQLEALKYRVAIDVFTAMVNALHQNPSLVGSPSTNELINLIAADLSDGQLDAMDNAKAIDAFASFTQLELNTLKGITPPEFIAGTNKSLSDIVSVFLADSAIVSPDLVAEPLSEPIRLAMLGGLDSDGDGAIDVDDFCPRDPAGTTIEACASHTISGSGTLRTLPNGGIADSDYTYSGTAVVDGNTVRYKLSQDTKSVDFADSIFGVITTEGYFDITTMIGESTIIGCTPEGLICDTITPSIGTPEATKPLINTSVEVTEGLTIIEWTQQEITDTGFGDGLSDSTITATLIKVDN